MEENKSSHKLKTLELITRIISSILIAGVGIFVSWLYNERSLEQEKILRDSKLAQEKLLKQQEINTSKINAIREFIPHLVSDKDNEKKTALLVLDSMGYEDFVTKFASVEQSKGSKEAGNIVMARPESLETTPVIKISDTPTKKELGWVYLGDWNHATKSWNSRYFDYSTTQDPESTKASDQEITVRESTGSVNIRVSPPRSFGKLGKVKGILKAGSKVNIVEIKEWFNSGYMWARVEG